MNLHAGVSACDGLRWNHERNHANGGLVGRVSELSSSRDTSASNHNMPPNPSSVLR